MLRRVALVMVAVAVASTVMTASWKPKLVGGAGQTSATPFGVKPAVLLVPDDYATIEAAVNAADDGDTIMVGPGDYAGCTVNKSVEIVGSGPEFTTITSSTATYQGLAGGFRVRASNVSVSHFRFLMNAPMVFGVLIDGGLTGVEGVTVSHDEFAKGSGWPITIPGLGSIHSYFYGVYSNGATARSAVEHNRIEDFLFIGILWYGAGITAGFESRENVIADNDIYSELYVATPSRPSTWPAGIYLFALGDGGYRHRDYGCLQLYQGVIAANQVIHNKIVRINGSHPTVPGYGIYLSTSAPQTGCGAYPAGALRGLIEDNDIGFNDLRGSPVGIAALDANILAANALSHNKF